MGDIMAAKRPRKRKPTEKEKQAKAQLIAVILFTIGLLVGALSFIKGEKLWLTMHDFMYGLLGWTCLLVAPLLIYTAIMLTTQKNKTTIYFKGWIAGITILLLSGATQIFIAPDPVQTGFFSKIGEIYSTGVALKGGGLGSVIFGSSLLSLFGKPAANIMIVLLIFICIMILTGGTLIGLYQMALLRPAKKIEQAYIDTVSQRPEKRPVTQATDPEVPFMPQHPVLAAGKQAKFDIDIPLNVQEQPAAFTPPPGAVIEPEEKLSKSAKLKETLLRSLSAKTIEPTAPCVLAEIQEQERKEQLAKGDASALKTVVTVLPPKSEDIPISPTSPTLELLKSETTPTDVEDIINKITEQSTEKTTVDPLDASQEKLQETLDTITINDVTPEKTIFPEFPKEATPVQEKTQWKSSEQMGTSSIEPQNGDNTSTYQFPPLDLLNLPVPANHDNINEELKINADILVDTLKSFGVSTRIVDISRGPSVTRYELQPSAGVKISKITGLADDIALNLASAGVRIEAPIPNKPAVGIEVPNKVVSPVAIREIIGSTEFDVAPSKVSISLGKDIAGAITVGDIAKMPHMLIAGSTGSGKSVCINSIIISLLYKANPDEVKLLMIDPKVVELGIYNGIPHLLVPVVTDPKKAAGALNWAVAEMLKRYALFASTQVRDLFGYNRVAKEREDLAPMPQIVIIIDELADLMMAAPNDVEDAICRLAQMARAAGMHLIIATQRPSVDVITGVIKANIPSRISFAVSSQIDSRTILDGAGAEKLLGKGDMLYYPVGMPKPTRVQGCFVTDKEVENVVNFIKQNQLTTYDETIVEEIEKHAVVEKGSASNLGAGQSAEDEMLQPAIQCVVDMGQASTSLLQRRLKLGYARAARLIDEMEARGIVGGYEGAKPRQVLISKERLIEMNLNKSE